MRFSVAALIVLGASCVALCGTASAQKVRPASRPITGTPIKIILPSSLQGESCTMGSNFAAQDASDYIEPPDSYYTYLDPSDCPDCDASRVELRNAHIVLEFQAACSQPVELAIVADRGDGSCPMPDPENQLCTRAFYTFTAPSPGTYEFIAPLPTGCCVLGGSFLEFTITQFGNQCDSETTRPLLVTSAEGCQTCSSYNYYPGFEDDLCGISDPFPGPPVHFADGACCTSTPVKPSTWGSLKNRYRGY